MLAWRDAGACWQRPERWRCSTPTGPWSRWHPSGRQRLDELDGLDADVYFLQELSSRWDEELQRRGFWQRFPWNKRVVGEDSFGCAIAARVPVRDLEVFWLTELPEMRRVMAYEGHDVELLSIHVLPPRTSEYIPYFRQGVDGVVNLIQHLGARTFILAGDFNATPDSAFAARMRPLPWSTIDQWVLEAPLLHSASVRQP